MNKTMFLAVAGVVAIASILIINTTSAASNQRQKPTGCDFGATGSTMIIGDRVGSGHTFQDGGNPPDRLQGASGSEESNRQNHGGLSSGDMTGSGREIRLMMSSQTGSGIKIGKCPTSMNNPTYLNTDVTSTEIVSNDTTAQKKATLLEKQKTAQAKAKALREKRKVLQSKNESSGKSSQ